MPAGIFANPLDVPAKQVHLPTPHIDPPPIQSNGGRNPNGERVLWGDFLALQLLRLRRVDFELLQDLREEYLDLIAANQEGGGVSWTMLNPLLTEDDQVPTVVENSP